MLELSALPRHRLSMGTGVHLLVDLENVQPSPQEVEAWLGKAASELAKAAPTSSQPTDKLAA